MGVAATADAAADATVSIELDFNAFADDVPPTRHARRVARLSDPSVQDFADQALELATLRMELKRLNRECEALRRAVQVRDVRVQTLQDRLRQAGIAAHPSGEPFASRMIAPDGVPGHELSHTLDLLLANAETKGPVKETSTVAIPPPAPEALAEAEAAARALPLRQLVPLGCEDEGHEDGGHEGEPIPLSRDILTIGRAKDRDICISSGAVSRDHARLVMSTRAVTLFDMDSANGCFVNDARVKRHRLRDQDVLRIGDRFYRFEGV